MNCKQSKEWLSPFLDGMLTVEESRELAAHLDSCPECRQELEELRTLQRLLAAEPAQPAADFFQRLGDRLSRQGAGVAGWWQRLSRKQRLTGLATLAAALLLVTAFSFQLWPSAELNGKSVQPEIAAEQKGGLPPVMEGGAGNTGLLRDSGVAKDMAMNSAVAVAPDRKLVQTAMLELAVRDVETSFQRLQSKAGQYGGYVENAYLQGNRDKDNQLLMASITLRLPASKMDEFISSLSQEGRILSSQRNSQDITLQYTDMEARLNNLKVQEKRLLELYQKATKVEDILRLEEQVGRVRGEIDSLTAQLKVMNNQVQYASLTINLQKDQASTIGVGEESFWSQLSLAFREGTNQLLRDIWQVVLTLVYNFWRLLLATTILVALFWWLRRYLKK